MVKVSVEPLSVPWSEPLTFRPVAVSRPAIGPLTELPDWVRVKVPVPGPLESETLPDQRPARFRVEVVELFVGELGLSLRHPRVKARLTPITANQRRMVDSFRVERNPESRHAPPPRSQEENSVIWNWLAGNEIRSPSRFRNESYFSALSRGPLIAIQCGRARDRAVDFFYFVVLESEFS